VKRWLFAAFLPLLALALAGAKVSPQGIVINPEPGDLKVKVWVDKDPGKTGRARYRIGERIYIFVTVTRDAYVYLFDVKPNGQIDLFVPNPYEKNHHLRAGETRRFPPPGARYAFTVDGPPGEEIVLAIATRRPLTSREIGNLERGEVRVRGLKTLARALSIAVDPLPNHEWASDWAKFLVVGTSGSSPTPPASAPVQRVGTLEVHSEPSHALVYVDNAYVGQTPLVASVEAGRHRIVVKKPGYQPYEVSVRLNPGERVQVYARLYPEVERGRLSVRSDPEGARVYLNGNYQGKTPLVLDLRPGVYDLRLTLPGYGEYRERVRVNPGETTHIYARLAPQKARLEVRTNVRARVFLDGYELGWTTNGRLVTSVQGGRRWLVVLAPGYVPYVKQIVLTPGASEILQVYLERIR